MKDDEDMVLSIEGVTIWQRYGGLEANRIDLNICCGEKVLVYGKDDRCLSDLFDIVAGLRKPDEGKMRKRGTVSFLPEVFPFMKNMKVEEYIRLTGLITDDGRRKRLSGRKPVRRKSFFRQDTGWIENSFRWKSALRGSVLEGKESVKVQFLSESEQCELLLHMACTGNPDLLLMGACFRHLNEREERHFWENAAKKQKESGFAVLVFSPFREIPFSFDKVYELSEGKLCRK